VLASQLNDEQNRLLKNQIVGFAKLIATAAGGILGIGKVSTSEDRSCTASRGVSPMRLLGTTGVKVSPVALGTMSFGGDADEAPPPRSGALRDAGQPVRHGGRHRCDRNLHRRLERTLPALTWTKTADELFDPQQGRAAAGSRRGRVRGTVSAPQQAIQASRDCNSGM
jgi:hypothetical protein